MFRRVGKFTIDKKLIDNHPHCVSEVLNFLHFIPTYVEYYSGSDCYEYTGHSPKFDLIALTEEEPKYDIKVQATTEGHVRQISFKRVAKYQS